MQALGGAWYEIGFTTGSMNGDGCVWVPGVGRYGVGLMDTSWIDPFFGPDGFKVGSTEKYLWRVSRRHHRDRAGRDLLGTIETGRPTSNVAWRRRPHVVCDRRDVGLSNQTHDERRRILMPSGANEVRHRKAQLLGLLDQTLIGHLVELVRARENPQKAAIRRAHH